MKIILLLLASSALAHESGEMSVRVGPGQGIQEFSKEKGFKLGPEAVKRLGLAYSPVTSAGQISVPYAAVVRSLSIVGIYRLRDGYIKSIPVRPPAKREGTVNLSTPELHPGDQVLTQGIGFVRVIESAFGKPESADEHAKHAGEGPDAHAGEAPDAHAGEAPDAHAGETPDAHAEESPDAHSGEKKKKSGADHD